MTDRNGTTVSWLASNYPKSIVKDGSSSSVFEYTPDRRRWRHEYKSGGTTYSHVYLGNLLEKVSSGGVTEWKHYLQANGKAFALYIRSSSGATTSRYLFNDHLGSGDLLTDTAGAVVLRESFDAYGKRRGSAWSGEPSAGELATMNATTRRGFTMHEHLDSTGLIHMNGRVYDPLLGRFVSADPLIDERGGTQGWNRFGYVGNRVLSFEDANGHEMEELFITARRSSRQAVFVNGIRRRPLFIFDYYDLYYRMAVLSESGIEPFPGVSASGPPKTEEKLPEVVLTGTREPPPPVPQVDLSLLGGLVSGPMPRNLGGDGQEETREEPADKPCTPARSNNPGLQDNIVTGAQVGAIAAGTLGALLVLNVIGLPEVQIAEGVALSVGGARVVAGLFQAALAEPGGSMAIGGLTAASYGTTVGGIFGYLTTEPTCRGP